MAATTNALAQLKEFGDITRANEPLAPYTLLRVGGPAEAVVRPRSVAELRAVLARCVDAKLPVRVLGGGGNVLISDEGVAGVVLRLEAPPFTEITTDGRRVRAGCGATLTGLIAHAAHHGLAGLETLVGLPGTVGGALFLNAGDRSSEIGQYVRQVEVLDSRAAVQVRDHDDLRFTSAGSNLDDPVLLSADFELEPDVPDAIVKRLRKAWIQRKGTQPFSYQHAGRMFKNPPGLSAAGLVEQAGLVGTKVGGAHVDDRNANYVVAEPGATARDVRQLIDQVRDRVEERFHVELELAVSIW